MAKVFKTLRNNWKKSVFFSGVAVWGAWFAQKKYVESEIRRVYCEEAQKYGTEQAKLGQPLKKVTIFLNPASKKGKGKDLFDKNVAPYFYLSGMEVTVVKTEYEGQAKKYMEVLENADLVVVAGGNGTVLEVVTGLLRKSAQENGTMLPLGVIPLGNTNSLASYLFQDNTSHVKWLAEASMSVIQGHTRAVDIMHIQGENDKDVYALSGMHWGVFKEAEERKKRAWWIGPLKHYWPYFRMAIGDWPQQVQASFFFTEPCGGCNRCVQSPQPPVWRWWHFLLPPKMPVIDKDYSNIENEKCGSLNKKDFSSLEFRAQTRNNHDCAVAQNSDEPSLIVSLEPETMSKTDFIKEGASRKDGTIHSNPEVFSVGKFLLEPISKQGNFAWFTIDNEEFEAMKIAVQVLPNKLTVFCNDNNEPTLQSLKTATSV